jgi:endonuclease/exonuclease/phosphatase family metal-dependent hydrolase
MNKIKVSFFILFCLFFALPLICGQTVSEPRLRLLTINTWSGLDYQGFFKFGEYESGKRREERFAALVKQVKKLDPDVVFVQEANFAGRYARRLAATLGFTEIHQVLNGGIKFGPFGIPVNFKEGMAILARPTLRLGRHDVWKLSGPFGLYGDFITFNFDEAVFSLVGKIIVKDTPFYLVNVHLAASPPNDEDFLRKLRERPEGQEMTEEQFDLAVAVTKERNQRREKEIQRLLKGLKSLPEDAPVIIAGDFNAEMNSSEIQTFISSGDVLDTLTAVQDRDIAGSRECRFTWDAGLNENIAYASRPTNASGRKLQGYDLFNALGATIPRRIDYIFLNNDFQSENVLASSLAINSKESGLHASDHFGVFADVDLGSVCQTSPQEPPTVGRLAKFTKEFLPILMYDTDIGFGYGLKAFLLSPFHRSESFDFVLFNSTKGERWYKFVFSWPDFERRQGKIYPLAVDFIVDYDKMIKNNFFGVGNGSRFEDRFQYTREPLVISLGLSRGFTMETVGQIGLKYATIKNALLKDQSGLSQIPPALDLGRASYVSIFGNFRYDSRDSFIHPSEGVVLQAEAEYALKTGWTNVHWTRLAAWFQAYRVLFYPKTIFALRLGGQSRFGENFPVQILLPLGGNSTLRGSPQDRFLDKSHLLLNAEIRFPIFWRFGGILGLDAGKVWPSLGDVNFRGWFTNPTVGLRFYMKTFVVRLDIGLGKESTGFYFNFGHLF